VGLCRITKSINVRKNVEVVWWLHIKYCQYTGNTCLVAAYTVLPANRKHPFGGCMYSTASIKKHLFGGSIYSTASINETAVWWQHI
jgi:hypothetical protein